jgi:YggT family protein
MMHNVLMLLILISRVLEVLVMGRILLSWFPVDPNQKFPKFLIDITEPLLAPIRRFMPDLGIPMDLSPVVFWVLMALFRSSIGNLL